MKYHHLGIPTEERRDGERYLPELGMFVSGYESSDYGIEWMRFEEDSPLPPLVKTVPHVAFEVRDLEAAIEGKELLIAPNSPREGMRVAFIIESGAPVEFVEARRPVNDPDSAPTDGELDRRRREWATFVNETDLESYADLVTENVVWLPPSGAPITGREAFRAWLEPFFDQYEYTFSVQPLQVRTFDGWCAESGRFESILSGEEGGTPREHAGEYFVLWRLDPDDVWRIERYVDRTQTVE